MKKIFQRIFIVTIVSLLLIGFFGCREHIRYKDDYIQLYRTELDTIFGEWTVLEKKERSFTGVLGGPIVHIIEWNIEYNDANGNILEYTLSNHFDFSFENIVRDTSYYALTHEIANIAGKTYSPENSLYNFTKEFSRFIYIGNYNVNNPNIDFNSPAFYPRNLSLSVLQNNNVYFCYSTGKMEEEALKMADAFNNKMPGSLNFLIKFNNTEFEGSSGYGYIKGEKIPNIIREMEFRDIFNIE